MSECVPSDYSHWSSLLHDKCRSGAGRRGGDAARKVLKLMCKTPRPGGPHERRSQGEGAHEAGRQEQKNRESRAKVTGKRREAGEEGAGTVEASLLSCSPGHRREGKQLRQTGLLLQS